MDRSGLFEEAWDLTIKPTLRELRSPARQLLIEEGLPMIAAWLRDAHSRTGEQRYRRLELIFDPDNDSLAPREFIGA
jgi:hypothetical protein